MILPSPLRAIIVDDEPLAREGLKLRLKKLPEISIVAEASDGDEAIELCHALTPNILFLDLHLPGLNGIEVVQALQSDVLPMVVFVSAYGEYALEAFELNAIDYLLKPVNLSRLQKTVARIVERYTSQRENKEKYKLLNALGETSGIAVAELETWLESDSPLPRTFCHELVIKNSENEKIFLPVKRIRWIDAAGDYMCIHTEHETHIVRITMKKLVSQLDARVFKRIHKSTLVNIHCIKSIRALRNNESLVALGDYVNLKVSRHYNAALQESIEARQALPFDM
ncbi:LytTR family DNA-binding domain-containing protein [uncultured Shewanella sp.]|uniref:LytR/AlgR family response regulator transcription factor n=1 Tax=uncultured Shewanella sp. TaxID=173975 RepID=UPI0026098AC9|nr:LytTR family DNA-binding domain-containing protein [uncultured Shewanella sp.]